MEMERTLEQETVKKRTSELEMVMEQIWICLTQGLLEMELVREKVLNEGEWC